MHKKFRTVARCRHVEGGRYNTCDAVEIRRIYGQPIDVILQRSQIGDVGGNWRTEVDRQLRDLAGDRTEGIADDHLIISGLIRVHISQNQRIGG